MGEGAERVNEYVWDQALSARVGQSIVWVERFRVIEAPWQVRWCGTLHGLDVSALHFLISSRSCSGPLGGDATVRAVIMPRPPALETAAASSASFKRSQETEDREVERRTSTDTIRDTHREEDVRTAWGEELRGWRNGGSGEHRWRR